MSNYPILATVSWFEQSMTRLPRGEGIVYAAIFNKLGFYARAVGGDTCSQIVEINQTCRTTTSAERLFAKGPGGGDSVLDRLWSHGVTHVTYFELFRGKVKRQTSSESKNRHSMLSGLQLVAFRLQIRFDAVGVIQKSI
jgi:hypothetical protein